MSRPREPKECVESCVTIFLLGIIPRIKEAVSILIQAIIPGDKEIILPILPLTRNQIITT